MLWLKYWLNWTLCPELLAVVSPRGPGLSDTVCSGSLPEEASRECFRNHQGDEWPGQKEEEGRTEGSPRVDVVLCLTWLVE